MRRTVYSGLMMVVLSLLGVYFIREFPMAADRELRAEVERSEEYLQSSAAAPSPPPPSRPAPPPNEKQVVVVDRDSLPRVERALQEQRRKALWEQNAAWEKQKQALAYREREATELRQKKTRYEQRRRRTNLLFLLRGASCFVGLLLMARPLLSKAASFEGVRAPGESVPCPNCGRMNSPHTTVCPRCDERLL